ncbi:hypothetical protein C8Q76DRAFT_220152 [Earliella scabrosa]|nr:hypothetical protein C8Q76DRAFT_220152 [Earliella scabrosa]
MPPLHFWSDVWVALRTTSRDQREDAWDAFEQDVQSYCVWGANPQPNTTRFASYAANICNVIYDTRKSLFALWISVHELDPSTVTPGIRQSIAVVTEQAFLEASTSDRRPTADELNDLRHALDLLLFCAAPDPAALEGDSKTTVQVIRRYTHRAISVFFDRFRALVRDTSGETESDVDRAWLYMNEFIDDCRRRPYQDEEFHPDVVDGLASVIAQDERGIDRLDNILDYDNREWFQDRIQVLHELTMAVQANLTSANMDASRLCAPAAGLAARYSRDNFFYTSELLTDRYHAHTRLSHLTQETGIETTQMAGQLPICPALPSLRSPSMMSSSLSIRAQAHSRRLPPLWPT